MARDDSWFEGTSAADWVILAGAGVSAPSGLPCAAPLVRALIHELFPGDRCMACVSLSLRFEGLLAVLEEVLGDVRSFLDIFSGAQPNPNHELLGRLVAAGAIVFTTNFDGLIEHCVDSRLRTYRAPDPGNVAPGVFVVHGTVSGPEGAPPPVATLGGLARARHDPLWRAFLSRSLEGRNLLVVGYSGGDDFDLIPWISERTGNRSTLWAWHDDGRPAAPVQRSDVETGAPQPAGLLASWRAANRNPLCDRCEVVKGDTRALLAAAEQAWIGGLAGFNSRDCASYQKRASECATKAARAWVAARAPDRARRQLLAGEILTSIDRHPEAAVRYLAALASLGGAEDVSRRGEILAALGEANVQAPDEHSRQQAKQHAEAALRHLPPTLARARQRAEYVLARCAFYADRLSPDVAPEIGRLGTLPSDASRFEFNGHLEFHRKMCRRADAEREERPARLDALGGLLQTVTTRLPDLEAEAMVRHELAKWTERWADGTDRQHREAVEKAIAHLREALRLRLALEQSKEAGASANVLTVMLMKEADWRHWESGSPVDLSESRMECEQILGRPATEPWDRFHALLMRSVLAVRGEYDRTGTERESVARDAVREASDLCTDDPLDSGRLRFQQGLVEVAFGQAKDAALRFRDARIEVAKGRGEPATLLLALIEFWLTILGDIPGELPGRIHAVRSAYHFRRCSSLAAELERWGSLDSVAAQNPAALVDFKP